MIELLEKEVFKAAKKAKKKLDYIKIPLKIISDFFDRILHSMSRNINQLKESDMVSSVDFNKYLDYIERDINLIKDTQFNIKSRILSGWNSMEQVEKPEEEVELFDNEYLIENPPVSEFYYTVLGVKKYSDVFPSLKAPPILSVTSSDKDIPVYHGKAYGQWIEGNETGEDGIRPTNNDGSLIVDNLDTFWEAEGVVLQETRENTVFAQEIKDTEISISATAKFVFKDGVDINTITVVPHSFSTSAYFKLISIIVSNGIIQQPINISETLIVKETTFTFESPFLNFSEGENKIKSINLNFRQDQGYYMKYDLGYFKIGNNESWVDITGHDVLDRVMKREGNVNNNITAIIKNAVDWIVGQWLWGIEYDKKAVLDTTKGTNGYFRVQSRESYRKRFAIGITDIKIGNNEYESISEGVTKEIDLPGDCVAIQIDSEDSGKGILYYISVDNGLVWYRIIPVGGEIIRENFRTLPKTIYINSDISQERKKNSDEDMDPITGYPYLNTESRKIRIKVVLNKETEHGTPVVEKFKPIFLTGNPFIGKNE